MTVVAWWSLSFAIGLTVYTYAGYPLLLYLFARLARGREKAAPDPIDWPSVTITVPAYNEERTIAATLDALLRLEYPRDRLEILVISDASTDRTDEVVRGYATEGVRLLRLPQRGGKTVAENAARREARGEVIVNTDASVWIPPHALRPLVAAFADPDVAVASGRDISVPSAGASDNAVEGGYVGYEMWLRDLETRAGGIIGTSGCFFASRTGIGAHELPPALSWDFAAPLLARELGYRSVSVPEAVCQVPRTGSIAQEYRRKVRTIARGMQTLRYKARLLNVFRYGTFAWMLFSHKVCRWLVPWAMLLAAVALGLLAVDAAWARLALGAIAGGCVLGGVGWFLAARGRRLPRPLSLTAFLLAGHAAVLHAGLRALSGAATPTWEPTRRGALAPGASITPP